MNKKAQFEQNEIHLFSDMDMEKLAYTIMEADFVKYGKGETHFLVQQGLLYMVIKFTDEDRLHYAMQNYTRNLVLNTEATHENWGKHTSLTDYCFVREIIPINENVFDLNNKKPFTMITQEPWGISDLQKLFRKKNYGIKHKTIGIHFLDNAEEGCSMNFYDFDDGEQSDTYYENMKYCDPLPVLNII